MPRSLSRPWRSALVTLYRAQRSQSVKRYLMPGCHGINFLIHDVLGGGGMASLRNDAQGKGYGQLLLDAPDSCECRDRRSVD